MSALPSIIRAILPIVRVMILLNVDENSTTRTRTTAEPSLHLALELYAHVAVTAASSTLEEIISCLEADNRMRQQALDSRGELLKRRLFVSGFLASESKFDGMLSLKLTFHFSSEVR